MKCVDIFVCVDLMPNENVNISTLKKFKKFKVFKSSKPKYNKTFK